MAYTQGTLADIKLPKVPGWVCSFIGFAIKPSPAECRQMLLEMREKAGLNQGELAALLGVDTSTLRRWEEGRRNPSSAARRLIELVARLYFEPHRLDALMLPGGVLATRFRERGELPTLAAMSGGTPDLAHPHQD